MLGSGGVFNYRLINSQAITLQGDIADGQNKIIDVILRKMLFAVITLLYRVQATPRRLSPNTLTIFLPRISIASSNDKQL